MPAYSLKIQFDEQGLNNINGAGQQVALVKAKEISDQTKVIWVAFPPMQKNTITWTNQYFIYSTSANLHDEAGLETISPKPAGGGNSYTFRAGYLNDGSHGLMPNLYGVVHGDPAFPRLTVGLAQDAAVNGNTQGPLPLNAEVVLYNQQVLFSPIENVLVFVGGPLKQSQILDTSWLTRYAVISMSNPLSVDFTQGRSQTIHYESTTNQFLPGLLPAS